jgi:hypothetical protein
MFRRVLFVLLALSVAWFPVTELCGWAFTETAILIFAVPGLLLWIALCLKSEPLLSRIGLAVILLVYLFGVYVAAQTSLR